jgi:hypothetical protein
MNKMGCAAFGAVYAVAAAGVEDDSTKSKSLCWLERMARNTFDHLVETRLGASVTKWIDYH